MTTLKSAPGKPKFITLTEWPDSLLGAYKAHILTGLALMEAERIVGSGSACQGQGAKVLPGEQGSGDQAGRSMGQV